jgi:hypothetical protein
MSNDERVRVRHIGTRARRCDTMSGEGTEWNGYGDIKEVSRKAWEAHLSRYKDLWELVVDDVPREAPPQAAAAQAAAVFEAARAQEATGLAGLKRKGK